MGFVTIEEELQRNLETSQLLDNIDQDDEDDAEPEPRYHSARWCSVRKEQALFEGNSSSLLVFLPP